MLEKQQNKKESDMKKTKEDIELKEDDLQPEYIVDYTKAKKNPYFNKHKVFIEIDEEVADAFESSESINNILRTIVKSIPKNSVAVL